MTPERQREAIAEMCPCTLSYRLSYDDGTFAWHKDPLTDLNAMHEAEKVLGGRQFLYIEALERVLGTQEETLCKAAEWALTHATAAQKAEAFLKVMGKWEEKEK